VEHSASENAQAWVDLDGTRSALHRLGTRRTTALIAGLTLLFIALRCVHLDADPPTSFGTRPTRELVAEPAAKSHEARNYALFGSYHLNEADDYQFWRAQSPVWVYPLTGFFAAFGTDWPQLRLFSTLYAALGVAFVLAIAARLASTLAVLFIGALLAFDSLYFHYSRAGLLEPAVNTWVAASVFGLILAERRRYWLIFAHWALMLAFFTKQAGLVAVPVVALATAWLLFRDQDPQARPPQLRLAIAGNLVLILIVAGLYVLNSDYYRAVVHNVNHILMGSDAPPAHRFKGFQSIIQRFTDSRYRHFFATVAVSGPLALAASGTIAYELYRRRRLPYAALVLACWFLCAFGAMFAIAWSALRFWTMVVLPAALLAGIALDVLFAHAQRRGLAGVYQRIAVPCAVVLFGVHLFLLREPLLAPRYTLRDGARAITASIGPGPATVLGAQSPGIVLGTPYKNFYLRSKFNATKAQLEALAPTHFLFIDGGDGSHTILKRELPDVAAAIQPILSLTVRGVNLKLYAADQKVAQHGPTPSSSEAN
jgi:4-amino-4-deoxy-L-arabinose transferase-like glycosyltransferase